MLMNDMFFIVLGLIVVAKVGGAILSYISKSGSRVQKKIQNLQYEKLLDEKEYRELKLAGLRLEQELASTGRSTEKLDTPSVSGRSMAIPNKPAPSNPVFVTDPALDVPAYLRNKASKDSVESALLMHGGFRVKVDNNDSPKRQMNDFTQNLKKKASKPSFQSV